MRSMVAGPQKVTTFSGCSAFEANSVQFSSSVVSDSLRPHGLQHPQASLSRSEGWKSFMSGCLMSGPQIKKKIIILRCHLPLFHTTTTNHFLMDCDVRQNVDFIWQLAMTSSVVGPRRSSKALSKAKLALKKGDAHCMVVCCQSDPLQLSESQWNHYFWDVRSANQWDVPKTAMPEASIGQQKWPNSSPQQHPMACHTTNASKLNEMGYEVLPHPPYSPDLSPTDYHFFKYLDNFLQGKRFHNQQEAENALQEFTEFRGRDFYTTGINQLISHWWKCVGLQWFLFWFIKMCLTHNDLKFMVQNYNNFSTIF